MKNLSQLTEKNLPKIYDYHEKNRAFYISDFDGLKDEFLNKYDCERIATYMEQNGLIDWNVERVHLTEFGENVINSGNWLAVVENQKKREEQILNSQKERERLELDLAKSNLEANRINAIEAKRNQRDRKHNRITTWINIALGILNFGILIWQILKISNMDINDFLENPGNEKYNIDSGLLMINLLQYSIRNKVYLQYILDKQIEIKEMLNGKTGSELADDVQFKIEEIEESIQKIVGEEYGDVLDSLIKKD